MYRLWFALGWLAIAWWGEAFVQMGFMNARLLMKAMMLPALGFPGFLLAMKHMLDERAGYGKSLDFEVVLISVFGGALLVFFAAFPLHMLLVLLPFKVNILRSGYLALSVLAGLFWLTSSAKKTA